MSRGRARPRHRQIDGGEKGAWKEGGSLGPLPAWPRCARRRPWCDGQRGLGGLAVLTTLPDIASAAWVAQLHLRLGGLRRVWGLRCARDARWRGCPEVSLARRADADGRPRDAYGSQGRATGHSGPLASTAEQSVPHLDPAESPAPSNFAPGIGGLGSYRASPKRPVARAPRGPRWGLRRGPCWHGVPGPRWRGVPGPYGRRCLRGRCDPTGPT